MKLFSCQACGQILFFENEVCTRCGHRLGFLVDRCELSALEGSPSEYRALAAPETSFRSCANAEFRVCNWLIPASSPDAFCAACRHNRTVPNLAEPDRMADWAKMEQAKHRLFYTLVRLNLPRPNRVDQPHQGLVFDFLADPPPGQPGRVMTGHDEGVVTLALTEADDVERETRRKQMGEPYRTLLGHFRHEVGHFYWNVLLRDRGRLEEFRAAFGDERVDYGEALARHYHQGAPSEWQRSFVSAYATSHPWEDWAETWAHYLHIIDGLETAAALSLRLEAAVDQSGSLRVRHSIEPYESDDFEALASIWLPLTVGLNAMNQGMGLNDLYPFVLSTRVIGKLSFIHRIVREEMRPSTRSLDGSSAP